MSALRERSRDDLEGDFDLVAVVKALRALRTTSQIRRYRGAPPPLPSREIILEIVEAIVSALYPRHFGPADLAPDEVDAFILRALESALAVLRRQIELELALAGEWKGDDRIDSPLRAGDVVQAFAAALPKVRALLDSDVRAAFEGDPSAKSIDEIVFCFPGFAAIIRHRLAHELYDLGVTLIARIIAELAHSATGIDIHPGAQIGERLLHRSRHRRRHRRDRGHRPQRAPLSGASRWGRSGSRPTTTARSSRATRAIRSSRTTW